MSDNKGYSVLPYTNIFLSLLSIALFVASSWYFQSAINIQKKHLLQLTSQQRRMDDRVNVLSEILVNNGLATSNRRVVKKQAVPVSSAFLFTEFHAF